MLQKKREHKEVKPGLHPRNPHRKRYDFGTLTGTFQDLAPFVIQNPYQDDSIDFFNPEAVIMLNKALLKHYYGVDHWDIPQGYLCPPIPGRADYIHYAADLLALGNSGKIPNGNSIRCLDIGTGANCIYPILGNRSYGWSFVGTDIDTTAIDNAINIIQLNPILDESIELRHQVNSGNIFRGVIKSNEHFDLTICNPPFHASAREAASGSLRKINHLKGKKSGQPILNFGGQSNELWCNGGEEQFVRQMIRESRQMPTASTWYTVLISKSDHLAGVYHELKIAEAGQIKTIPMHQGNKISRIVAWNFSSQVTDGNNKKKVLP